MISPAKKKKKRIISGLIIIIHNFSTQAQNFIKKILNTQKAILLQKKNFLSLCTEKQKQQPKNNIKYTGYSYFHYYCSKTKEKKNHNLSFFYDKKV